ncbi:MAG: gluconokinase [Candidatus Goldiibacteriota bacterium]
MVYIIMGVMGAGKTTAAKKLAEALNCSFFEGDDYHSAESIEKMRNSLPLDDDDRAAWLEKLRGIIDTHIEKGKDAVIACSILKEKYRAALGAERQEARLVYLKASEELIRRRLEQREGHFASPALLKSQFEALEEPKNALVIDASLEADEIVFKIIKKDNEWEK